MIEFTVITLIILLHAGLCKNRNYNHRYLQFWFFVFGVMGALRAHTIGNDTPAYCRIYSEISSMGLIGLASFGRFELGYTLFNRLLLLVTDDPQFLLIVTSIIIFYSFYKFVKKESNCIWLCVVLFFTCGLFKFSLSAIRQCLALSILLFGYQKLKEEKYIQYGIIVALAFFFHRSSIIFSILLFAATFNWSKKIYWISVFGSVGIAAFIPNILGGTLGKIFDYSRYMGSNYDDGINIASLFLTAISLMMLFVIWNYNREKDNKFFSRLVFIKVCILIISIRLNSIDRMADYCTIFEIVGVSNVMNKIDKKQRLLVEFGIIGVYVVYSIIWGIYRPEYQHIWPFEFYWMN